MGSSERQKKRVDRLTDAFVFFFFLLERELSVYVFFSLSLRAVQGVQVPVLSPEEAREKEREKKGKIKLLFTPSFFLSFFSSCDKGERGRVSKKATSENFKTSNSTRNRVSSPSITPAAPARRSARPSRRDKRGKRKRQACRRRRRGEAEASAPPPPSEAGR